VNSGNFVDFGQLVAYKDYGDPRGNAYGQGPNSTMTIQCPHCNRPGQLPDDLLSASRRVRCRKCNASFVTVPTPARTAPAAALAPTEISRNTEVLSRSGRFYSMSAFPEFDDESGESATIVLGPGDSHYELPVTGSGEAESEDDRPALELDRAFRHPVDSDAIFAAAASGGLLAHPWYYRFLHSCGRIPFLLALGIGIGSLAGLGFFLVRALIIGQTASSSITALVLACVSLTAFILLSVTATALYLLLLDLARNARAVSIRPDLSTTVADD
jgi:hypothetical protein